VLLNITNGVEYGVHNNNNYNLSRAVLERVFLVQRGNTFVRPPQPDARVFNERMLKFKNKLRKLIKTATPYTPQEFVDSYDGRKRIVYSRALESLNSKPFEVEDSFISAFVKAEKCNFSAKVDPAPRVIQPRSPRYNLSVGLYIKKIEHHIYRLIKKLFGAHTVAKGMNAIKCARIIKKKWDRFDDPVAVGLDASRFDQHCSEVALRWEHDIYRMFYPHDKELDLLLKLQLSNRCYGRTPDGVIKYRTLGCRMSGDMNTGLGNCLLMCAMVYSYMDTLSVQYELVNNGDDCVLFMERKHLKKLASLGDWFVDMGYTMKIESPVDVLEHVEFCQTRPVFNGECYVMTRDPRICLTKDLVSVKNLPDELSWRKQVNAIGQCGLSVYGNIPIFCEFYKMMDIPYKDTRRSRKRELRSIKRGTYREILEGFHFLANKANQSYARPTSEAYVSFWRAFGITPDTAIAVEEWYSQFLVAYEPGPTGEFSTIIALETLVK
jgi:hypothetical protein